MALPDNPFVRYRERLDSYDAVRSGALSDQQFVEIVEDLDAKVAAVDGHGFSTTPIVDGSALAAACGLDIELVIKDESNNVGGSHKARHLFGTAIRLLVAEAAGAAPAVDGLAIASCGNAAMGAAVVARALDRRLQVFVPDWADAGIVAHLQELGSEVQKCERRDGEAGDPAYLRFREAAALGAQPFSVQGTDTATTFDGGRTLGWEFADQVADTGGLDALYIQVGGGALATSVSRAMPDVRLHPVQAEGCAPLRRAWDALEPDFDFAAAATDPSHYMYPWDDPQSFATGILDDVTYDWLPLLSQTRASGGWPIVAAESLVVDAYRLAHEHTTINVCATGSSGFAGLLAEAPSTRERVGVLFTGIDRT